MPLSPDPAAVWIEPWRHVTAAEMARVYRTEHARLVAALDWDTTATWTALEHGRLAGTVAGLVARDGAGAIVGWTFFVERGDELQIGAFTASAEARSPLLAGLLATPEAQRSAQIRLFGHTNSPGLAAALTIAGFQVGAYDYLTAGLVSPVPAGPVQAWRHADLAAAAALMRAAYADRDPLRPFGGAGRADDWIQYVIGLTTTAGCGVFAPELSVVVRSASGDLDALALVTRLGPSMAHLAQLAVAPSARRRGFGARVLDAAMGAAATARLSAMSLLVASDNDGARGLYVARGFRYSASFMSASAAAATAGQPRRSTSAAWVSGGVSTRR